MSLAAQPFGGSRSHSQVGAGVSCRKEHKIAGNSEAGPVSASSSCGTSQAPIPSSNQRGHEVHASPTEPAFGCIPHPSSAGPAQPGYNHKGLSSTHLLLSGGLLSLSILGSTVDWGRDSQAPDESSACLPPPYPLSLSPCPGSTPMGHTTGGKSDIFFLQLYRPQACSLQGPRESVTTSVSSCVSSLMAQTKTSSVDLGEWVTGEATQRAWWRRGWERSASWRLIHAALDEDLRGSLHRFTHSARHFMAWPGA